MSMNQDLSIRQQIANILTELFGNRSEGKIFLPEHTKKRTGGGKKHSAYDLKTSQSWTAKSIGDESIWVSCVGMTMAEFIKEHGENNIYYQSSKQFGFPEIFIYRNKPEWKTSGYVINLNREKDLVVLHFSDLLFLDKVETSITKETPKWLIETPPNLHAAFFCKIYQGWRGLNTIEGFDWSKVWKTFKLDSYLSDEDLRNYF